MSPADQINQFVHAALLAGARRDGIDRALAEAGWTARERSYAIGSWIDAPELPPVPRPRPYVSAREAVLYGLLFVSLASVAISLCSLGIALIERFSPDGSFWGNADSIRWSMSWLIAFTPVFLFINYRASARIGEDAGRRRSLVRKWFASMTLLFSSLALLGDLVFSVYAFLTGDMTLVFAAKAGLVAVVAALILVYYKDELDA